MSRYTESHESVEASACMRAALILSTGHNLQAHKMQYYQHSKSDFSNGLKISKLPAVYVLLARNSEFVKIGYSNNLKGRISNIQSGCPFQISLWLAIRTPIPKHVEKYLLEKLHHCRGVGEWFTPSENDLYYLLSFFEKTNSHVREVHNALLQA